MAKLQINPECIYEKLSELKVDKSPDPNMLHPRVLKQIAVEITDALRYLFEVSLDCDLPHDWKSSIVSVIHRYINQKKK